MRKGEAWETPRMEGGGRREKGGVREEKNTISISLRDSFILFFRMSFPIDVLRASILWNSIFNAPSECREKEVGMGKE